VDLRDLVAAVAPDIDPEDMTAVGDLLAPIWATLAEQMPGLSLDEAPAFAFDPVRAQGGPRALPALAQAGPAPRPARPASAEDLPWLPIADQAALVADGTVRAAELVEAYAARIARYNEALNAIVTPVLEAARAAAERPLPGRLSGVPVGVKDIMETAGVRTTGGSRILGEHVPSRDSAGWARLRAAGAILLGKTHTQEFAAGPTGENRRFGWAHNPWDTGRMPGGSSSGSGAAVAAALVGAALGSDTGGSIRIPAALCGVAGIKPTYGWIDATGVYPLSWSLDHVGPLARTVRDAALLLDVLSDAAGGRMEASALAGAGGDLRGLRVGVPVSWLATGMQAGVARAFEASLDVLRGLGAQVLAISPSDSAEDLMALNRAIALAEGSAWHEPFLAAGRAGEYGANVRPRKQAGRLLLATEYLQAQRLRAVACRRFGQVWDAVDLFVLPTLPVTAPAIGATRVTTGEGTTRPVAAALLGWCGPLNVIGGPAVSVPCGLDEDGLPVGLQLVAPAAHDAVCVYAAAAYEAAAGVGPLRPTATP